MHFPFEIMQNLLDGRVVTKEIVSTKQDYFEQHIGMGAQLRHNNKNIV